MRIQDTRNSVIASWKTYWTTAYIFFVLLFFIHLFIKQTVFFEMFAGDDCFWHSFSSWNKTRKKMKNNHDDDDNSNNSNDKND